MAMYTSDEPRNQVVIRYAAGAHAPVLDGITRPRSTGIAGWVAHYRRPVLNAEPILDLGFRASAAPALRSSLVVPLIDEGALVAVLALYSTQLLAFTDDHVEMLDVLGPRLARTLGDAVVERRRGIAETPVLGPFEGLDEAS
jgi:GAF domain-containing protein